MLEEVEWLYWVKALRNPANTDSLTNATKK